MHINFTPLSTSHFSLLLKWLEMPHVKLWWDEDIKWSLELIEQKYSSYVRGYKLENNRYLSKPAYREEFKGYTEHSTAAYIDNRADASTVTSKLPLEAKFEKISNEPKNIQAYIIEADRIPIGYIQIYNAYDFERSSPLINLPSKLAAIDFFLGEVEYLNKGIGLLALKNFLENFIDKQYTHILVDPDRKNIAAIKTYEKAGFKIIQNNKNETLMLKELFI
ncbi:GNAT family N-acetyltransferase [Rickettsia hoogstraalii]|uniref:GNAT family N-acetyltransferase n=1 Tax=Rickettsia hoogstraalii TaxID=467174 RepID=UPI00224D59A1|nr:GNAT family N-acetyltransferase [Rickettsia hoogstraalii]MCX4083861.1 GNAT family N-acetyltransferase [Rickettsia hoogstraalii]